MAPNTPNTPSASSFLSKNGDSPPPSSYIPNNISSDEETESDYDSDDEEEEQWRITPVNVVELEKKAGNTPLFTRELLENIAAKKRLALEYLKKPVQQRETKALVCSSSRTGKKWKVWVPHPQRDAASNYVQVNYTTRVEMHPAFHQLPFRSDRIDLLHEYNKEKASSDEWIPAPYVFETYARPISAVHRDQGIMKSWRKMLGKTQNLWQDSQACEDVKRVLSNVAQSSVQIKKIVCFGLGELSVRPEWAESVLRHLTVFTIASELDKLYRAEDPSATNIEILVQDPCYMTKDKMLLTELHPGIKFVEDPEGLLAVDKHTLVVAAFVPCGFPLMQIIADLFSNGQGPAGFIVDDMSYSPGRQLYTFSDRMSPNVGRMLTPYKRWKQLDGRNLGEELRATVLGKEHPKPYWLEKMRIWTCPVVKSKNAPESISDHYVMDNLNVALESVGR